MSKNGDQCGGPKRAQKLGIYAVLTTFNYTRNREGTGYSLRDDGSGDPNAPMGKEAQVEILSSDKKKK